MSDTPARSVHATGARPAAPAVSSAAGAASRDWSDVLAMALVLGVALALWLPRTSGPIDLRWDGAVYYILGTSLAEGRGYKLLNEPGQIDAVQYPPLLPAVVALHQVVLGTTDPAVVGPWLRLTSFLIFLTYAAVVLRFLRRWLAVRHAVIGTLLSVFCLHAWFLSDALFPEVWFSVATLLFLMFGRHDGGAGRSAVAYLFAVASYALRTVGLAAFAVWVLDSLLRRRFRQAAVRTALALIPVLSWQLYVASVERSEAYTQPAYEYQRAPYLFYNVSYARNIALRDPFTPEKGEVRLVRRVVRNALQIPAHLGEALSTSSGYYEMWLHRAFGQGPVVRPIVWWGVFLALWVFGGVLVLGGVALQLVRGQTLVPLYVLVYLAALCLTPFPGQYLRYVMPIVPLLALSGIVFLAGIDGRRGGRRRVELPFLVLGPALAVQVATAAAVFAWQYQPVAYVDAQGRFASYRLFYYGDAQREFDLAVDYLQRQASAGDVIAAGTPHWIHLRTGHTTVMPPFEQDAQRAQALLDSVPVTYLVIGQDVVATERYTAPVVARFPERWAPVHTTPLGAWTVYRRVGT